METPRRSAVLGPMVANCRDHVDKSPSPSKSPSHFFTVTLRSKCPARPFLGLALCQANLLLRTRCHDGIGTTHKKEKMMAGQKSAVVQKTVGAAQQGAGGEQE